MHSNNCFKLLKNGNVWCSLFLLSVYSIILFQQSESLNIQNKILLITIFFFFFWPLGIAFKYKYKFDYVDFTVFIFYIYLTLSNYYVNGNCFTSSLFTIQLFFLIYFIFRILCEYYVYETQSLILIFISSIFLSLIGVGQFLGIINSAHSLFPITGTFFNPGPYACYLSVTAVMAIIYLTSNYSFIHPFQITLLDKRRMLFRILYYLGITSAALAIIIVSFANSRSALLGLVFPLLVYIFHNKMKYKTSSHISKYVYYFFVIAFISIILTLYFIRPDSVNGRLHIWKVSLSNLNNPIICGSGMGAFPKQYIIAQENYYEKIDKFEEKWKRYADTPSYAFNEYLHLFVEAGAIGLILFLLLIYLTIKEQLFGRNKIFGYGNISILVIALTSYPFHLLPFLLLFATTMSVRSRKKEISFKITMVSLILISVSFFYSFSAYYNEIDATIKWEKIRNKQKMALLEIRDEYHFSELYEVLKNNDDFLFDYGTYLRSIKKYEKSNQVLFRGYEISNNPDFALLLAKNYSILGYINKAENYYKAAFKMLPNRIYPLYCLALHYYDTKQYNEFITLSEMILNFAPKIQSVRTNIMKDDIEYLRDELLSKQE